MDALSTAFKLQRGLIPSHSMDNFANLPKISVLHQKCITTFLSILVVHFTKTNTYCYAVMAISIIIVLKVPELIALIVIQPILVTKNAQWSNNSGKAFL